MWKLLACTFSVCPTEALSLPDLSDLHLYMSKSFTYGFGQGMVCNVELALDVAPEGGSCQSPSLIEVLLVACMTTFYMHLEFPSHHPSTAKCYCHTD